LSGAQPAARDRVIVAQRLWRVGARRIDARHLKKDVAKFVKRRRAIGLFEQGDDHAGIGEHAAGGNEGLA